MRVPLGQVRAVEFLRALARGLGDLLEVITERDPVLVRLGKPELVLRERSQAGLGRSKKEAVFPNAASIWVCTHGCASNT